MSKPNAIKAKPSYWYSEDDIAHLLTNLASQDVDVFAQTQFEHEDLLTDNFREAIRNVVETGRAQLMPIHLHGNHWAAAIVRMQANGQIQVIYNDPLGDHLEYQPNAMRLRAALQSVVEGTDIIDLRLRQQNNGNDCGPFTVDNLLRLASCPNLDGLGRDAILRLGVLATPVNGSAIDIRNRHAEILPRLRIEHIEDRSVDKLRERKVFKSDEAFWGDVKKLLKLKRKIHELGAVGDTKDRIKILSEIGEIAKSVCRKEIDKSAIRNRFSSNEQGKKNILYLDVLELLVHLKTDQNRVNDNLFESAFPDVISDLEIISVNIDAVLSEEKNYDRAKRILSKDEMLKEVESIRSAEPKENATNPKNLKAFISSFYVPKALERMRQAIPLNRFLQHDELSVALSYVAPNDPKYNWDDRIDRYSFARTFAILGELSRSIRNILPPEAEVKDFFRDLNKIRDNLKKKAHKFLIADGNLKGKITQSFFVADKAKLNDLTSSFKEIDENLAALQTEVFPGKLRHNLPILTEFVDIFKGEEFDKEKKESENPHKAEVKKKMENILSKKKKLETEEKKGKKDLTKIKQDLKKTQEEYGNFLEKIEEEYRRQFPSQDDLEAIKAWVSEDSQNSAKKKTVLATNEEDEKRLDFIENCKKFEEEAERLKAITSYAPENEEQKQRHEFAVAHSVGIIGEAIRYLFEIDDETNFLEEFASRKGALAEDINETMMVRNKQVMHGILDYDPDQVIRAATQNTTPWKRDVKAIALVHEFIETMSREGDYLEKEAKKIGISSDEMQMRMMIFVGESYVRLGKMDEAAKILEQAKSIALSSRDNPAIKEIIKINTHLSFVERSRGDNASALDLIDEALGYIAKYPQYQLEKPQLLNNKATLISEVGDDEEAKKLYREAMSLGFAPAAMSLGQILCKENRYDDAIAIYKDQFLKINPEKEKRPFEFIMALRGLRLAQSESGKFDDADKTFNFYVKFYRSNIPLFKEFFGQSYKGVESLILRDEANDCYCKGHYRKAINRLENALSLLDEGGFHTSKEVARLHLVIATSYKSLSSKFPVDRSEAADSRSKAVSSFQKVVETSDNKNSIEVAHAYAGLAEIYFRTRRSDEARDFEKKARAIFKMYGDFGGRYAQVMDDSLRTIRADHDIRLRKKGGGIVSDDEHALFQGGLLDVASRMKSNDHEGALAIINSQIEASKKHGVVNPSVLQLNFQKFVCYCRLDKQSKAMEAYSEFEAMVEKYPDCAESSCRDMANRIFYSSFKCSLPSKTLPSPSVESAQASGLADKGRGR
jgi:tetratricopeptide (TPR) repeat protein